MSSDYLPQTPAQIAENEIRKAEFAKKSVTITHGELNAMIDQIKSQANSEFNAGQWCALESLIFSHGDWS